MESPIKLFIFRLSFRQEISGKQGFAKRKRMVGTPATRRASGEFPRGRGAVQEAAEGVPRDREAAAQGTVKRRPKQAMERRPKGP